MASLPLVPLGTVLMPGATLPLQLFEPRYLRLLRDLLAAPPPEREFGVVALRRGVEVGPETSIELHEIGCVARVLGAWSLPGTGRVSVETMGMRRFRLVALDPGADTPYLTGDIDSLPELPGAGPDELERLTEALGRGLAVYRELLGAPAVVLDGRPEVASYAVADALVLDVADRQQLLAAPSTAGRLRLAATLVHRETVLVERLGALPRPAPFGAAGAN
jgi:Lon protease-like protein